MAALPPPPKLSLDQKKATPAMVDSLEELRASLLCPLCNQMLLKPSTLACGHNFCLDCIEHYTCNSWSCPVVGCGMPVTARGGRDGSYLKINPQLETVVSSFDIICKTLNSAPSEWWKEPQPEPPSELEDRANEITHHSMEVEEEEEEEDAEQEGVHEKAQEANKDEVLDFQADGQDENNNMEDVGFLPPTDASSQDDSQKTVKFRAPPVPLGSSSSPFSSSSSTSLVQSPPDPRNNNRLLSSNNNKDDDNEKVANMSCILPSQSPGFSPIATMGGSQSQTSIVPPPGVQLHGKITSQEKETKPDAGIRTGTTKATSLQVVHTTTHEMIDGPPKQPKILFTSVLQNRANKDMLKDLLDESKVTLLLDNVEDEIDVETDVSMVEFMSRLENELTTTNTPSIFAICNNAEFETGDGYLVPRTFGYLLAIACGMPLLYMNILQDMHDRNKQPTPSQKNSNKTTTMPFYWYGEYQQSKYQIIADVDAANMNAPQRALENRRRRQQEEEFKKKTSTPIPHSNRLVGTSLLKGYIIFLHGDFDVIASKRSRHGRGTGRKRSRTGGTSDSSQSNNNTANHQGSGNMYSRRRMKCLLQLCGAQVFDLEHEICHMDDDTMLTHISKDTSKVAVLVRPNPRVRDWRAVQKTLGSDSPIASKFQSMSIVKGNWLLDCISNFEVLDFHSYEQSKGTNNRKKK